MEKQRKTSLECQRSSEDGNSGTVAISDQGQGLPIAIGVNEGAGDGDTGGMSIDVCSSSTEDIVSELMKSPEMQLMLRPDAGTVSQITRGPNGQQSLECHMQQVMVSVKSSKMSFEGEAAGPESTNPGYGTLHMAILHSDDPNVVKQLINAGCDVNRQTTRTGESCLHVALRAAPERQETYVKMLLDAGCRLDIQNRDGDTVLHACKSLEILDMLLNAASQDVMLIQNNRGFTPLHCFIDAGLDEAVDSALDKNTDPDITDFDGNTVLHLASMDEVTSMVIEIDVREWLRENTDEGWMKVFSKTCMAPGLSMSTYKRLMARSSDLDGQNNENLTPLHLAVQHNCLRVVKLLLNGGANAFEIPDSQGRTVYDVATAKKDLLPEIIGLLEERLPNQRVMFLEAADLIKKAESSFITSSHITDADKSTFRVASSDLIRFLKKHQRKEIPMNPEHRTILLKSFDTLLAEIAPSQVLEVLQIEGIFNESLVLEVEEEVGRRAQCKKLLEILMSRGRRAFPVFCKALTLTNQTHVLEMMKDRVDAFNTSGEDEIPLVPMQGRPMLEEHKKFIVDHRSSLLEKMSDRNSNRFFKKLVANGVLTKSMVIEMSTDSSEHLHERILDILPYRGRNAFPVFCQALVTSDEEINDSPIEINSSEY